MAVPALEAAPAKHSPKKASLKIAHAGFERGRLYLALFQFGTQQGAGIFQTFNDNMRHLAFTL